MKRLVSTFGAALLVGCGTAPPADPPPPAVVEAAREVTVDPALLAAGRIDVQPVADGALEDWLVVNGELEPDVDGVAEVASLGAGRIEWVGARAGDAVRAGQVLAILRGPEATRASGDAVRAQARRARAETVLEQERTLRADQAGSVRAVVEAEAAVAEARADENAARAWLATQGSRGGSARLELRAPIDGLVVAQHAHVGDAVDARDVLFRIVSPTRVLVRADVPELDASAVRVPGRARLRAGNAQCEGDVEAARGEVEPERRTVAFRVRPAADCVLGASGAYVEVSLARASAAELVRGPVLPRDAIVDLDGVPVAFVERAPAVFALRSLRVERSDGVQVRVEGVHAGERVAVRGALLLAGELRRAELGGE